VAISVSGVGSEAEVNSGTTLEVTPPTVSDGQFMMLFAGYSDDALTPRVNETGWTLLASGAGTADGDRAFAVWGKFASGESGTYTVDTSEGVTVNITARLAVFDGVHADMLDQTSVTGPDTSNSATYDPAAIVTQTANAMVITFVVSVGGTQANYTDPSGYTNLFENQTANPLIDAAYKLIASPGSEDPGTWNVTTAVRDTIGPTLALKAAVAGSITVSPNLAGMSV